MGSGGGALGSKDSSGSPPGGSRASSRHPRPKGASGKGAEGREGHWWRGRTDPLPGKWKASLGAEAREAPQLQATEGSVTWQMGPRRPPNTSPESHPPTSSSKRIINPDLHHLHEPDRLSLWFSAQLIFPPEQSLLFKPLSTCSSAS